MVCYSVIGLSCFVALRKESVDRNKQGRNGQNIERRSLSARRAWIEISQTRNFIICLSVALRKESVDRNYFRVAKYRRIPLVALRKESVDRNRVCTTTITTCIVSLSARRAWIEIGCALRQLQLALVALRKESVDRNNGTFKRNQLQSGSLSARRAWIEIGSVISGSRYRRVALRKESVDRNPVVAGSPIMIGGSLSARRAWIEISCFCPRLPWFLCRSPQGERG